MAAIREECCVNSDYAHSQRVRSNTPPLPRSGCLHEYVQAHAEEHQEMTVKVWFSDRLTAVGLILA